MSKILITGISSGIGRELIKKLIGDGHSVFGLARRKALLATLEKEVGKPKKLKTLALDVSAPRSIEKLLEILRKEKFVPGVVIFNAAILENDLAPEFNPAKTRKMFSINFFSVMDYLRYLLPFVQKKTHFIAVSSVAALRGSSVEGIGYAASKAALSTAFEAFHQKYKKDGSYHFTNVYFGPVRTGMSPFVVNTPFQLKTEDAVSLIIKAIEEKKPAYYAPFILFFFFRLIRLLPVEIGSSIFTLIEKIHKKYVN